MNLTQRRKTRFQNYDETMRQWNINKNQNKIKFLSLLKHAAWVCECVTTWIVKHERKDKQTTTIIATTKTATSSSATTTTTIATTKTAITTTTTTTTEVISDTMFQLLNWIFNRT